MSYPTWDEHMAYEDSVSAPRNSQPRKCPDESVEVHQLGEFPMSCYRCHLYADS